MLRKSLLYLVFVAWCSNAGAQLVSTVAGKQDTTGTADGIGVNATFNSPHGVTCDKSGNIYIADRFNHKIRKIAPGNAVTTFAGSGSIGGFDGTGTAASFYEPWGIACDTAGNVYVADTKNYKIRKITPAGVVTTIAGTGTFGTTNGPAALARFGFPTGICVADNGTIYVADHQTHTIRKISAGTVSTLAGTAFVSGSNDGPGATASFNRPYGIELDVNGNILVADEWNHLIRSVTPAGVVSTIAGVGIIGSTDGQPMSSMFNYPWDVTVDLAGNIYVADGYNYTIRKITTGGFPMVSTFAGTPGVSGAINGLGPQASFDGATGIAYSEYDFSFYVGDAYNHLVRKIVLVSSQTLTLTSNHGNNKFCAGDTVTVYGNPSNLSNYAFYEGNVLLGNSANGTLTLPPLPPGQHTIHCTALDTAGATVLSNLLKITISAAIVATINPTGPITICQGDTATLNTNPGYQYAWSNGKTTQVIKVAAAGNYDVLLTDTNGCTGQSSPVQVNINPAPTATINPNGPVSICNGDSIQLTAGGGTGYVWSNGATTQSIYANTAGNYTVTVTDNLGCSATVSVSVSYYSVTPAVITPANFVVIIAGDSTQLTASSGTSYLWSNGATTQTITTADSGSYIVTVTNANGCTSVSAPVLVIPINSSTLVTITGATTFCDGDSVLLQSNLNTGNQWYLNGNAIPGATGDEYYATVSGSYYDVVTQTNGSSVQSDSIVITVMPAPANPVVTDATICEGEYAILNVQADGGTVFNWYDQQTGGTLVFTGLSYQTPNLTQTTAYFVEAIGTNGCVNTFREIVQGIVTPAPNAAFTHLIQSGGSMGFNVSFTNTSAGGFSYNWNFGDTASSDNVSYLENPFHLYSQAGNYTVTQIVSNAAGCSDTLVKTITVTNSSEIFIPTSFTPNQDGANDVFRVRGPDILSVDMSIYSQWGELVYHGRGQNVTWNGSLKGNKVQTGTYAYSIELIMVNGISKSYKGHISVIR